MYQTVRDEIIREYWWSAQLYCPKVMTTYFKRYDYLVIMLTNKLAVPFHFRQAAAVFVKYAWCADTHGGQKAI